MANQWPLLVDLGLLFNVIVLPGSLEDIHTPAAHRSYDILPDYYIYCYHMDL